MPTFDTPEPIVATIDIATGHVRIHASDRADTVVQVRPRDESDDADVQAAEQTQVEYANGRLLVKAPKNKIRSLFGRPASIDVTVELPSDSRVDAKAYADFRSAGRIGDSTFDTGVGSIRLDQTGRLKLRTGAGDISVGRAGGHTDVTTSSGKIWIGEIDGTAVVKTSNGDITVGEVTGDVRLNTANGDITVDRALATVAAKTAYGSVRIGEVVRGSVVLETGFGELELGVREGTAAWLDVSSQHGSVRSDLDAVDSPEQSDETVEVRARTGFGDIVIRRLTTR
jgi:DUF4097 and DUF4098 domain-containing protein YvlB